MIAISKNPEGYQARIVGKPGAILATGCESETKAIAVAQAALEIGPII